MKNNIYVLIMIIVFSNCVTSKSLQNENVVHDRQGVDILTSSPDSRLSFLLTESSKERFCLAPPPDALLKSSNNISLESKAFKTNEKIGDSNSIGTTLLSGRTPSVLVIRELMYRACELTVNQNLSKEESIKVYNSFLEMSAKIIEVMQKETDSEDSDDK